MIEFAKCDPLEPCQCDECVVRKSSMRRVAQTFDGYVTFNWVYTVTGFGISIRLWAQVKQ